MLTAGSLILAFTLPVFASAQATSTNNGSAEALGVTGTLTTSQAGVTLTRNAAPKFGDIPSQTTACGDYVYGGHCSYLTGIVVSTSVAVGTVVPSSLSLTDKYGNTFPAVSFTLTIH